MERLCSICACANWACAKCVCACACFVLVLHLCLCQLSLHHLPDRPGQEAQGRRSWQQPAGLSGGAGEELLGEQERNYWVSRRVSGTPVIEGFWVFLFYQTVCSSLQMGQSLYTAAAVNSCIFNSFKQPVSTNGEDRLFKILMFFSIELAQIMI